MKRHELAIVVAAALLVALAWTYPVSLDLAGSVVDGGDPLHLAWVMAWDAHQLVRAGLIERVLGPAAQCTVTTSPTRPQRPKRECRFGRTTSTRPRRC